MTHFPEDSPAGTTPSGRGLNAALEVPRAAVPDAADPSVRGTTSPRDVARGEYVGPGIPKPGPTSIAPPEPTTPALAGHDAQDPAGGTRSSAVLPAVRRTRRGRPGSGRLRVATPQSGAFDDGPPLALRLKLPEPPDEAA
jgi:hypothetical protein